MRVLIVVIILFARQMCAYTQEPSRVDQIFILPDKFLEATSSKSNKYQQKVMRTTEKYLNKLSRQELRMQRMLAKRDSVAAKKIFGSISDRYNDLITEVKAPAAGIQQVYSGQLDSMTTMLKFLDQNKVVRPTELRSLLKSYGDVQAKLNQSHLLQEKLRERQEILKQQLQKFGLGKEFRKYKEKVYYYRAQLDEYKKVFEDPNKVEASLLQLAAKVPAFSNFFRKYSQLASLFRLPGGGVEDMVSVEGLQTRDILRQELEQRLGTGPNTESYVAQGIGNAQTNLRVIKNKFSELGDSGNDMGMPDFKPNHQKTKSFWNRLEVGTNVQSTKGSTFLPATTDFGLSLGYRLNSKSTIGIGTSYKMGWGKDFRHISISHEGVGLRSFYEFKLKGSFWVAGGGELNYLSSFIRIDQLKNYSAWQRTLLMGVSKKYQVTKKFKGSAQLLYDFLHSRNVPRTQPVIFRIGYHLK